MVFCAPPTSHRVVNWFCCLTLFLDSGLSLVNTKRSIHQWRRWSVWLLRLVFSSLFHVVLSFDPHPQLVHGVPFSYTGSSSALGGHDPNLFPPPWDALVKSPLTQMFRSWIFSVFMRVLFLKCWPSWTPHLNCWTGWGWGGAYVPSLESGEVLMEARGRWLVGDMTLLVFSFPLKKKKSRFI